MLLALLALALIAFVLATPRARRPVRRALRPRPRAPRRAARPRAAALVRERGGVGDVPRPGLHPCGGKAHAAGGRPRGAGRVRVPRLPAQADRRVRAGERPAAVRVLRRVPRPHGERGPPPAAGVGRRPRQVDGPHLGRGPRDPAGQHAPDRPPARPRPRAPRLVAPGRVGAPARRQAAGTAEPAVSDALRRRSRVILDGPDRAQARAYLKGVGFDDDALKRPIVGIANTWTETMPCNFHLRRLAEKVKEGVRAAGGTPMEFNTVAISDGITMGTEGMKTSLVSREVIADSIELVARGHMFDAIVALSGCDKTIPGCVMALARLSDVPSLMLYGGSIAPGHWRGKDVTIQDVFEGIGAHAAGDLSDDELLDLENHASPGAGACGGQFTANTMACAFEALGISPGGSSMVPAEDGKKGQVAEECGRLVLEVLAEDRRPSKIITKRSLENAIAAGATSGGSPHPRLAPPPRPDE